MSRGGCQTTVLDHDAAVHHYVDAAGFGAGGGFRVDDSLLDPEVGKAELEHLVDDSGDELRQTEDIDDVGFDWKIGEACVGLFAEDLRDGGDDGGDLVAALLHVCGDVVAQLGWGLGRAKVWRGGGGLWCCEAGHYADDVRVC